MEIELNEAQREAQARFRAFIQAHVTPVAEENDRQENTPPDLIQKLAQEGYLGALIDQKYGGGAVDILTWGLLCAEIGRASASLLSLLTVHSMVIQVLNKWGSEEQRQTWLPKLASGEVIGAFGLTEPNIGSDAKSIETQAATHADGYLINGEKRWISFGQMARLFLIFAQHEGKIAAFLVERERNGFSTEPITGLLGFRSAMLARVHMRECVIPATNLMGRIGFGFSHVGSTALDHGRYCVAWGCLGLTEACLDASLEYTEKRYQFGATLKNHQLIQEMIAEMIVGIRAARLLCYQAAFLKQRGDPSLIMETSIAKYYTSRLAMRAANDAVQIHGANGCSSDFPVQRYLRDAKVMEIIEGSNQMQQIIISKVGYQEHLLAKRAARHQGGKSRG
ncbi:MAG: acyl-CoA dehydrogenase family protein [Magnetococcales bacterium]|nr:acyl-CoA dehydrogenase family protein [Magnetococcales bacterium]